MKLAENELADQRGWRARAERCNNLTRVTAQSAFAKRRGGLCYLSFALTLLVLC